MRFLHWLKRLLRGQSKTQRVLELLGRDDLTPSQRKELADLLSKDDVIIL
jgi:hypothetical protein